MHGNRESGSCPGVNLECNHFEIIPNSSGNQRNHDHVLVRRDGRLVDEWNLYVPVPIGTSTANTARNGEGCAIRPLDIYINDPKHNAIALPCCAPERHPRNPPKLL